MAAGSDLATLRGLVERICSDPGARLLTDDGVAVRPVWPPVFESLPHATKVCQAAVRVERDGGGVFNVSLCDVRLVAERSCG